MSDNTCTPIHKEASARLFLDTRHCCSQHTLTVAHAHKRKDSPVFNVLKVFGNFEHKFAWQLHHREKDFQVSHQRHVLKKTLNGTISPIVNLQLQVP